MAKRYLSPYKGVKGMPIHNTFLRDKAGAKPTQKDNC
jgi:hypothetical protein